MNRQIIGFVLGAVFLVILILIFSSYIGYAINLSVKVNNINTFNWLTKGIEASKKGGWDSGDNPKKLESTSSAHYAILWVDSAVYDYVNNNLKKCGYTDKKCYTSSKSFGLCSSVNSFCLCLVHYVGVGDPNNLFNTVSCSRSYLEENSSSELYNITKNGGRFDILLCKSFDFSGFSESDYELKYNGNCVYMFGDGKYNIKIEYNDNDKYFTITQNKQ